MRLNPMENNQVKNEMDQVIRHLQEKGIKPNSKEHEIVGLGDMIEDALNAIGITQERFKQWFGLRACKCDERKEWLNNLFSRKREKNNG